MDGAMKLAVGSSCKTGSVFLSGKELAVTQKDETEILSRRQFSILGLATLGLTLSSTVLMVYEVEAQPSTAPDPLAVCRDAEIGRL